MSWGDIQAAAAASQQEYAKTEAELAELTHYKLQVDAYGVWKVKVRRTPDSEPQLITARGGGSPRPRGEALPSVGAALT